MINFYILKRILLKFIKIFLTFTLIYVRKYFHHKNSQSTVYVRMYVYMYVHRVPLIIICMTYYRTCQEEHWKKEHRVNCKSQSQPPTVGVPFIVSLPKKKCTYKSFANTAAKFARLEFIYRCAVLNTSRDTFKLLCPLILCTKGNTRYVRRSVYIM